MKYFLLNIVLGTFLENTEAFKQLNVFPGLAESQALALKTASLSAKG